MSSRARLATLGAILVLELVGTEKAGTAITLRRTARLAQVVAFAAVDAAHTATGGAVHSRSTAATKYVSCSVERSWKAASAVRLDI